MTLSRDEAAQSLKDIERTQGRSFQAYGYKSAAPFLILWGALWMVGYGTAEIAPRMANLAWIGVGVIGTVASMVLGIRTAPPGKSKFRLAHRRHLDCVHRIHLGNLQCHRPHQRSSDGRDHSAAHCLVLCDPRNLDGLALPIAGLSIAAVTLGGYFYWPEHFAD